MMILMVPKEKKNTSFICSVNRYSSNSLCPLIKINILDRLVYQLRGEVILRGYLTFLNHSVAK